WIPESSPFQVTIVRLDITIRQDRELQWPKAHVPPRISAHEKKLESTVRRKKSAAAQRRGRKKRPCLLVKAGKIRISRGLWQDLSPARNGLMTIWRTRKRKTRFPETRGQGNSSLVPDQPLTPLPSTQPHLRDAPIIRIPAHPGLRARLPWKLEEISRRSPP